MITDKLKVLSEIRAVIYSFSDKNQEMPEESQRVSYTCLIKQRGGVGEWVHTLYLILGDKVVILWHHYLSKEIKR